MAEDKKDEKSVTDLKDLGAAVAESKETKAADTAKKEEKAEKPVAAKTEDAVEAEAEVVEAPKREKIVDQYGRAYATGRRKNAVARVWLKPGKGSVVVNGKDQVSYFPRPTQRLVLNQPFLIVDRVGQFDVMCTVKGGGLSGQAGAVRHAISRALQNFEPDLRGGLKEAGMLTRDSRVVERKKVGKHKARRSKQWAKR